MSLVKCYLCLDNSHEYLEIFSDVGLEKNICNIIKQHFWFVAEVNENNLLSKKICTSCWITTENFHNFYLKVKSKQDVYLQQQSAVVYIKEEERFEEQHSLSNNKYITFDIDKEDTSKPEKIKCEIELSTDDVEYSVPDYDAPDYDAPDFDPTDSNNDHSGDCDDDADNDESFSTNIEDASDPINNENDVVVLPQREKKEGEKNKCSKVSKENKKKEKLPEIVNLDEQITQYFKMSCDLCPTEFKTFMDAKTHYADAHQISKGYLSCCKQKLKNLTAIKEHIYWHTNPEKFTCKICNIIFAVDRGLKRHMCSHEPEENRPYKCDSCSKSFAKLYLLKIHTKTHTNALMDKKFKCDTCGKGYPVESQLRSHKRVVHEHNYNHFCDICARFFQGKKVLDRHINEFHLGIKMQKIQCKICEAWIQTNSMRGHMERHKDDDESKEYACKICGKKIVSKHGLKSHERYVHTMEPRYKCNVCDKMFKIKNHLKDHMASHTGESRYTCLFCPKTFHSNGNKSKHVNKIHPEEWRNYKIQNLKMQNIPENVS